tara:strand:- start:25 stop:333 length:309 start_codon:yes stop_codon:yes gene_type:complete
MSRAQKYRNKIDKSWYYEFWNFIKFNLEKEICWPLLSKNPNMDTVRKTHRFNTPSIYDSDEYDIDDPDVYFCSEKRFETFCLSYFYTPDIFGVGKIYLKILI